MGRRKSNRRHGRGENGSMANKNSAGIQGSRESKLESVTARTWRRRDCRVAD